MNDYRILVVDDEEDLCEILKFNLETEGFQVDTANSAEEALKLDLTQYNVLLLDVMMGEISGFRMASMMKKKQGYGKYPYHFHYGKGHRKRHTYRFQPWCGRLYFKTILTQGSTGQSKGCNKTNSRSTEQEQRPTDIQRYGC